MLLVAKAAGFGARLKELRENAGLTQADLAIAAGVKRQTVFRYETGTTEPPWSVLLKLAEALGVTPNDFIDEAE